MFVKTTPVYLTDFQAFILFDAIEREFRLLEIVTAQEREQGNRDGWALARIKVREFRSIRAQVVSCIPWTPEERYSLTSEDRAELAERITEVGLRMRPPRAEMEKHRSVKERRKSIARVQAKKRNGNTVT